MSLELTQASIRVATGIKGLSHASEKPSAYKKQHCQNTGTRLNEDRTPASSTAVAGSLNWQTSKNQRWLKVTRGPNSCHTGDSDVAVLAGLTTLLIHTTAVMMSNG